LFEPIREVLQPRGYVVESNKENCDCNLNEYWKSRPDCLVYHPETFNTECILSFMVTIDDEEENELTDYEKSEVTDIDENELTKENELTDNEENDFTNDEEKNKTTNDIEEEDTVTAHNDKQTVQEVYGNVIEVKLSLCNAAAMRECFCNMSAAGAKLALLAFQMGKIVETIHMYGVVISMKDWKKPK